MFVSFCRRVSLDLLVRSVRIQMHLGRSVMKVGALSHVQVSLLSLVQHTWIKWWFISRTGWPAEQLAGGGAAVFSILIPSSDQNQAPLLNIISLTFSTFQFCILCWRQNELQPDSEDFVCVQSATASTECVTRALTVMGSAGVSLRTLGGAVTKVRLLQAELQVMMSSSGGGLSPKQTDDKLSQTLSQ